MTPDGTRAVLDSEAKIDGLRAISSEMDTLAREVAREQSARLRYLEPSRIQIDDVLRKAYIPAAA